MKKEINILKIFLPVAFVIIIVVISFILFFLKNYVNYNELTQVSILRSNALACVYDNYTLTLKNGEWIAAHNDGSHGISEKVVDDIFVNEIKKLLDENKVNNWNGFNINFDELYDSTTIDFYMRFANGKEIQAHGYAVSPKNFYVVFKEFEKKYKVLFDE